MSFALQVALAVQIGINAAHETYLAVAWSVHLGINAAIKRGILFVLHGIMAVITSGK